MKKSKQQFQPESQNQEVQTKLNELLQGKPSSGSHPDLYQQKSLVRIEVTSQWRSQNGKVDNTLHRKVFYRKPLLTPQGKLDRERLALEILLHQ